MDQNIIGIKAVVDVLSGCDSNGCCYYAACYDACERPLTNAPKVDERCKTHPWDKENRDGKLCPFTAIWRAFGLEGLERGNPPESGMFKEESNDLRLELKFGEVFGCEVRVWSEDKGSTPHFHVRTMARDHKKTKKTIDCCVRIGEARYFKHGNHTGELNAQQRRKLNEFLKKDVEREDGQFSVWTCIMEEWNKHYPNQIVPKGTKQPDYTQIDDG